MEHEWVCLGWMSDAIYVHTFFLCFDLKYRL